MRACLAWSAALLLASSAAFAAEHRTQLYDVSADVLPVGESEWGLLWARYSRGLLPGVQVSTHLAGDAIGLLNASIEYQFLDREEARASVEVGAAWWPLLPSLVEEERMSPPLIVPIELRATVPLWSAIEVTLGIEAQLRKAPRVASLARSESGSPLESAFASSLALVRHDCKGAWLLRLELPLLRRMDSPEFTFLGKTRRGVVVFDDVESWSVMAARDFAFAGSTHLRVGLGYRNRPGVIVLDSIGNLLIELDLYWR